MDREFRLHKIVDGDQLPVEQRLKLLERRHNETVRAIEMMTTYMSQQAQVIEDMARLLTEGANPSPSERLEDMEF